MKKPLIITLAIVLTAGLGFGISKVINQDTTRQVHETDQNEKIHQVSLESEKETGGTIATPADEPLTSVAYTDDSHNFGEVKVGETLKHKFVFTNTGAAPLKLISVKPSCSCTATDYSKEEIAPGKTGYVIAEYPAKKAGVFKKTVTVVSNTEPRNKILTISGEAIN